MLMSQQQGKQRFRMSSVVGTSLQSVIHRRASKMYGGWSENSASDLDCVLGGYRKVYC